MKRFIIIFLLLIEFVSAETKIYTFGELVNLVSQDTKKNIYLDANLSTNEVSFNLSEFQGRGEIYELFKDVLKDNNLKLEYNKNGKFYRVVEDIESLFIPALINPNTELHYYIYSIDNITNQDVQDVFAIFPNVKMKFLKQSDKIAYSSTTKEHKQIERMLNASDNRVNQKVLKIIIFSIDRSSSREIGATINKLGLSLSGFVKSVFTTQSSSNYNISNGLEFDVYFQALEARGFTYIHQSPTLVITNGIESKFTSVKNIPYISTTTSIQDAKSSTSQTINYKDVGMQIKVLPKIKDGYVYLELDLIIEELISLNNGTPITQKITYKNSITIKENEPILITGLNKSTVNRDNNKLPIGLLEKIFKATKTKKDYSNFNILMEVI